MVSIRTVSHLKKAQSGARREIEAAFLMVSGDIRNVLLSNVGGDGKIDPRRTEDVLIACGNALMLMFVGADGRRAYNGIEPLSPLATVLDKYLVQVQARVVQTHADFITRKLRNDTAVLAWLRNKRVRADEMVMETDPVFLPNPLATYEAAHTWVDPKGYRLSDRIWRAGTRTRDKLDLLVSAEIRKGTSAVDIAQLAERFLLPSRGSIRTSAPYGLEFNGSFDAMRLARTEISRAHAQASKAAAMANPYVDRIDWALSLSHPRIDICDDYATVDGGGARIKEPYPKGGAPLPVASTHPHCLCHLRPVVADSDATVTARLREVYKSGAEAPMTPAGESAMMQLMTGLRWLKWASSVMG